MMLNLHQIALKETFNLRPQSIITYIDLIFTRFQFSSNITIKNAYVPTNQDNYVINHKVPHNAFKKKFSAKFLRIFGKPILFS